MHVLADQVDEILLMASKDLQGCSESEGRRLVSVQTQGNKFKGAKTKPIIQEKSKKHKEKPKTGAHGWQRTKQYEGDTGRHTSTQGGAA